MSGSVSAPLIGLLRPLGCFARWPVPPPSSVFARSVAAARMAASRAARDVSGQRAKQPNGRSSPTGGGDRRARDMSGQRSSPTGVPTLLRRVVSALATGQRAKQPNGRSSPTGRHHRRFWRATRDGPRDLPERKSAPTPDAPNQTPTANSGRRSRAQKLPRVAAAGGGWRRTAASEAALRATVGRSVGRCSNIGRRIFFSGAHV